MIKLTRLLQILILCSSYFLVVAECIADSLESTACEPSVGERLLLDRIEQLERRINELELRITTQLAVSHSAQTESTSALGTVAAQSKPASSTSTTAAQQNLVAWDKGGIKIVPYAFLVGNAAYNTFAVVPGNIAFFGVPKLDVTGRQFSISAGNTLVGTDIFGPKIGDWSLNGKFDFNLRGPTPVTEDNVFSPYFANVYIEAKKEHHRILAGLAADFISPLSPRSLNLYPGSYLPGDLGTNRPQVRYEYNTQIGDETTLVIQGGIATAVQTLQVSEEVLGFGTDVPDGQLRIAIGQSKRNPSEPKKPFELGISGHVGQRRTLLVSALFEEDFLTWSGNIDVTASLGSKARIEGEFFIGSILGDYKGGILHTFNPIQGIGVRAAGGWGQLQYQINSKLSLAGGYGLDDTFDEDLATGFRSKNDVIQGNLFYNINPRLTLGLELSRWHTRWVGLPDGRVIRIEPTIFWIF